MRAKVKVCGGAPRLLPGSCGRSLWRPSAAGRSTAGRRSRWRAVMLSMRESSCSAPPTCQRQSPACMPCGHINVHSSSSSQAADLRLSAGVYSGLCGTYGFEFILMLQTEVLNEH